jgi:hypothetical protein
MEARRIFQKSATFHETTRSIIAEDIFIHCALRILNLKFDTEQTYQLLSTFQFSTDEKQ